MQSDYGGPASRAAYSPVTFAGHQSRALPAQQGTPEQLTAAPVAAATAGVKAGGVDYRHATEATSSGTVVRISPEGAARAAADAAVTPESVEDSSSRRQGASSPDGQNPRSSPVRDAAQEQKIIAQLRELRHRDLEVRAHEQAHAAVGGHLTGAPTYEFVRGPDGNRYAVAGEVSTVDPKVPGDPEKTLQQAEQLVRAALAPAEPSQQDRQVAAAAARTAQEARMELSRQRAEDVTADGEQPRPLEAESAGISKRSDS